MISSHSRDIIKKKKEIHYRENGKIDDQEEKNTFFQVFFEAKRGLILGIEGIL